MSNSTSKELALVKILFNDGKYEEAIQRIKDIEQTQTLTSEEMLRTLYYKGRIYLNLGQFEIVFKIAEELYQKSQEMKLPLFSLDALSLKAGVFTFFLKGEEFFKNLERYENLFKSTPREDSLEFRESEAMFLYWKGIGNHWISNFNLAMDYFNKSLALFEQVNPHHPYIYRNFGLIAYVYLEKGELELALEYDKKVLNLIPKGEYFYPMWFKSNIYRNMGIISYQKGDLDSALEYYTLSLEIYEKINSDLYKDMLYSNIIDVFLAKKDYNQARKYLQKLKQLYEKTESRDVYLTYQYEQALILKSSTRMHDRVEAENILKTIIRNNLGIRISSRALINLCDWYFEEFQLSNQVEILDDIQKLIDELLRNARTSNSYYLLANVKLLQAKLALLQINMVDARKFLTEAQIIAEEHDLQLLAGEISREHDRLLEELKLWESIKKTQASVAERLKLASIDDVMERLQGRRAIEPLDSNGEQSILLLILAKGGVLLFSYPFTDKWKHDDDFFGSFLSAFSTLSNDFFSQGLDRAKFGEDTILLQSVESFSICYLFRGQTYIAKQKFEKFVETIEKQTSVWRTLENFEKRGQVAELTDLPNMESIINDIFLG